MTPQLQRAALYARVSTDSQDAANQLPALRQLAADRRYDVVLEHREVASGARRRPLLEQLLEDAGRRRFDVLVVWALDRLGRSPLEVLNLLQRLQLAGVQVVSVKETWLDSSDPQVRQLLTMILTWVAGWERHRLVERTKEGLARARAAGKRIGRPRLQEQKGISPQRVLFVWTHNLGRRRTARTARQLGISARSVRRYLAAAKASPGGPPAKTGPVPGALAVAARAGV